MFFIAYGWLGPLYPVLCLHLVLMPINIYRLMDVAQPLRFRLSPRRADYPPFIEEWNRGEISVQQKLRLGRSVLKASDHRSVEEGPRCVWFG